jgi:hypothetical protein
MHCVWCGQTEGVAPVFFVTSDHDAPLWRAMLDALRAASLEPPGGGEPLCAACRTRLQHITEEGARAYIAAHRDEWLALMATKAGRPLTAAELADFDRYIG